MAEYAVARPSIPPFLRGAATPTVLIPLVYLLLAVGVTASAWHDPTHLYVGGGADPQQSMWFLHWVPWAITHGHNPWVSDYMNNPQGFNVMWNTAEPLAAILLWPVTAVAGVVAAYDTEVTLGLALSAWFAFLATRRWVPSRGAAFGGGLVFGFSPYMLGQLLGHPHLMLALSVPLFILLLDDIVVRQTHAWWRDGILLGVLAAAQALISEEILVLEAIGATTLVIVLALSNRDSWREHLNHLVRCAGVAIAVAAVLLAWPLGTQLFGPQRVTQVTEGPDIFVSDGLGFILPTVNQLFNFWPQQLSGNASEWNAYLGIPLVLLIAWTVWRNWNVTWIRNTAITATAIAILSMGPHLHLFGHKSKVPLPWDILGALPLLSKLLPSRLMLIVFFATGLIAAQGLSQLWATRRRVAGITAALIVLTLFPRLPFSVTGIAIPGYFTGPGVANIPAGSPVLLLPMPMSDGTHVEPILWQEASSFRFKITGGYYIGPEGMHATASTPTWQRDDAAIVAGQPAPDFDLNALRGELTSQHIAAVIVGPTAGDAALYDLATHTLGPPQSAYDAAGNLLPQCTPAAAAERPPSCAGDVSVWPLTSSTAGPGA